MNKKTILRAAAALSISATLLCSSVSCGLSEMMAMPLTTYTLEHTDVENYISVSGKVEGTNLVKITSEVTSKVQTLNVEVGSAVKKGDVLCVFDSKDLKDEYDKLKKSADNTGEKTESIHAKNRRALEDAKADKTSQLQRAQRLIDKAVSDRDAAYAKYNQLYADMNSYYDQYSAAYDNGDEISAEKYLSFYESTKSQYNEFGSQLSSYDSAIQDAKDNYAEVEKRADDAIQLAQDAIDDEKYESDTTVQDQLDALKEKIDKCEVKAPKDGIITAISIAEGSVPTSEAIMTIEDDSALKITVSVNEADILKVKEGQKAVITTTATGEEEFSGKVDRIVNIMSGQKVNAYTGETDGGGYTAEISIDSGESSLLIGMSAKVKIILDEKSDVLAVPYDSIKENDDGTFSVFTAEKDEKGYTAKEHTVTKGMETNFLTEISASDLDDGALIITDATGLMDGQAVNISEGYVDPDEESGE